MARLNLTHEQIRSKMYAMSGLHEATRSAIADLIIRLSDADDWYPESFRRGLRALQDLGTLADGERHNVEKAFFPDHTW